MLAPVCLFTYSRLEETKRTVNALSSNFLANSTELFIFSDGPKNTDTTNKVNELRNYLYTVSGFKSINIIESPTNIGLANSIINGVSQIIEKYSKVIVLEDDLITTPNFLDYMNQALDFYYCKKNIQSVNGYSLKINTNPKDNEVYFHSRTFPWGWATWKDRWDKSIFEKDIIKSLITSNNNILKSFKARCGDDMPVMLKDSLTNKNDSWYARWVFNHFQNKTFGVFPYNSKVMNIGYNANGSNCNWINVYDSRFNNGNSRSFIFNKFELPSKNVNKEILKYFSIKFKILYRLKLLSSKEGRIKLYFELKSKLK